SPVHFEQAVTEAAAFAAVPPSTARRWTEAVAPITQMSDAYLHGDICENQLLVDESCQVTTVIDWDTAGIGHPLHDFDFGEWGYGIFAWEDEFPRLRQRMWDAYRAKVPTALLPTAAQVHLAFALA